MRLRSVAVILRCGTGETERLREGMRLYAGLVAGGLDVIAVVEGGAVEALADASLAEEREMLTEAGIPLLVNRPKDVLVANYLQPVDSHEISARLSRAEGRIIFDPSDRPTAFSLQPSA